MFIIYRGDSMSNIKEKINLLKENKSYQDFSEDIFVKTGYRIHYTTLQKYVTGIREPSKKTLKVLAEYSKKPISWFFDEDSLYVFKKADPRNECVTLSDFEDVIKEACANNIPPSAFKLFIKAVAEARRI